MGMGSDMYRQQILDHYRKPRNYGTIEEPTFTHIGVNTSCGDEIEVYVVLRDDQIAEVSFVGEGCAISQAAASMLTEEVKGLSLEELYSLDRDDVLGLLGVEVTPMRIKCAVLIEKVLQDGARIYEGEADVEVTSTE